MGLTYTDRKVKFESTFALVRDELLAHLVKEGLPDDVVIYTRLSLQSNVQGGKLDSGMSVVNTVELLKNRDLTQDEYNKAAVLGWSVELMQAHFRLYDDVISGYRRRGLSCWYRDPNPSLTSAAGPVEVLAIDEFMMLRSVIFQFLKTHFHKESYYADLVELYDDVAYKGAMGQLTDVITTSDTVDLVRFTLERYKTIVHFKTSFCSFYLPVAAAMCMCQIPKMYDVRLAEETRTVKPYALALSIFFPLGEYHQIQDDFLNYSAPQETLGKVGTDIVNNKCSWCIVTALNLSTPEQRTILERNYGRKGDAEAGEAGGELYSKVEGTKNAAVGLCEARVKQVYEVIGLRQVYADYQRQIYRELNERIDTIPEEGVIVDENVTSRGCLKREVFRNILDKIYGRGYQEWTSIGLD